jgi:hypothetical protein
MKRRIAVILCSAAGVVFAGDGFVAAQSPPVNPQQETDLYINPQAVEISGYDAGAMEPFISPDGNLLFFNNSSVDDGANSKYNFKRLYFAKRTGLLSFRFLGELPGVNAHIPKGVDGVPSLDAQGRFYFTSMRQYEKDFRTIFTGDFDGRAVTNVHPVEGNISPNGEFGVINMDAGISPDGKKLYISRARFGLWSLLSRSPPREMRLLVANRDGDKFILDPNGAEIMKKVNTGGFEYAPTISADGLELYYNSGPRIMVATRTSTDQPFGAPRIIKALTGFVEAPSISLDRKELFLHKRVNDTFVIFRAVRNPHARS